MLKMATQTSKLLGCRRVRWTAHRFQSVDSRSAAVSKAHHPLIKWYNAHKSASPRFPPIDPKEILLDPSLSYKTIVKGLARQAKNSVLLQVDVPGFVDEDYLQSRIEGFVSKIAPINYLGKAKETTDEKYRYYLVEFTSKEGAEALSQETSDGPLLRVATLKPNLLLANIPRQNPTTDVDDEATSSKLLRKQLMECRDMAEQMKLLHASCSIPSSNLRNKFFVNSLIDDFFSNQLSDYFKAIPYGTVMTGFSTSQSDVDISLTEMSYGDRQHSISSLHQVPRECALKYKTVHRDGAMKLFNECYEPMKRFLPNLAKVEVIPAKTPLLSFTFEPLNVFTEISLNNRSSVQMAWCINMYSRMDTRVDILIFLVREWARQNGVMRHGGVAYDGITPFMLTTLVLFYLMRTKNPVIPPMCDLMQTENEDEDWILGGFRTKLIENISVRKATNNTMPVDELFVGFLEYYRRIDFAARGFSLVTAETEVNRRKYLHIRTPLHAFDGHIGKMCNFRQLSSMQRHMEKLLIRLEDRQMKFSGYKEWGVLSFCNLDKIK